jgi:hypothetical protein
MYSDDTNSTENIRQYMYRTSDNSMPLLHITNAHNTNDHN